MGYCEKITPPRNINQFYDINQMKKQVLIILISLSSLLPVNAQITANFEADNTEIQNGGEVQFTDMSKGNITSWLWEFPGGTPSTSTSQNPTVTYDNISSYYDVTLTVSDGINSDTKTKEEYISVWTVYSCSLFSNFSASLTSIAKGESISFTDNSVGDPMPVGWEWSFLGGDPSFSYDQNPTNIKYNTPGIYPVTLKTFGCYNVTDTEVKTDYIYVDQPMAVCTLTDLNLSPSKTQGCYKKSKGSESSNYTSQLGKVGWAETKEFSWGGDVNTHEYYYRQEFSHPSYLNSQISQIKFTLQVEWDDTHYEELEIKEANAFMVLQPSSCESVSWNPNESAYRDLEYCLKQFKIITPISVSDAENLKTLVAIIDETSNVRLSDLAQSDNKFAVAFVDNGSGVIKIRSMNVDVTYNVIPPLTPTGLTANSESASQIDLSWNEVAGATEYEIYECEETTPLYTTTSTSYSITTGLQAETTYNYRVKAKKNNCFSSDFSECVEATTKISQPSNFLVTAISNSEMQLSWNAVTGAVTYEIYTCSGSLITSTAGTNYSVSGLSGGTNYSYKIRTIGSSSTSNFTACKSVYTYPDVPSGLSASGISSSSIALNWNTVTGASSYDIYSCSGMFIANSTGNSYTDTGLSPLSNYSYKIKAKNSSGTSDYSICADAKTKMSEPSSFSITALSTSELQLSWNGVSGSTQYEIYSCDGSLIASTTGTNYNISGLSGGASYSYKIRAISSSSTSNFTACISATTILEKPILGITKINANTLRISWNAVNGACNYDLYYCNGQLLVNTSKTYYDINIPNGNVIYVYVRANQCSNPSINSVCSDCVTGFISSECSPTIDISNQVLNFSKMYKSSRLVTVQNTTIEANYAVVMESASSIVLHSGFHSKAGSYFRANIVDCNTSNFKSAHLDSINIEIGKVNTGLLVYPNPSKGIYNVEVTNDLIGNIFIFNILGKLIGVYGTDDSFIVDISSSPSGIYIIRYMLNGTYYYKKIIKD